MADKTVEQPEVPVEEVEKKEKKVVEEENPEEKKTEDTKAENGKTEENGDGDKETKNGDATTEETDGEKCCIKRKSVGAGGDTAEETPADGATPEKKAKLEEPAESEASKAEAEVAA